MLAKIWQNHVTNSYSNYSQPLFHRNLISGWVKRFWLKKKKKRAGSVILVLLVWVDYKDEEGYEEAPWKPVRKAKSQGAYLGGAKPLKSATQSTRYKQEWTVISLKTSLLDIKYTKPLSTIVKHGTKEPVHTSKKHMWESVFSTAGSIVNHLWTSPSFGYQPIPITNPNLVLKCKI